jgi:hypothetical protein
MHEVREGEALAAECRVFCRYLLGRDAPPDVVDAYCRAHEGGCAGPGLALTALDRALCGVARGGPRLARIADSYAAVCARGSVLRRKLVLLVAILESRGSTAAALDTAVPGSRLAWLAGAAASAAGWAVAAGAGALVVVPAWAWHRWIRR